VIGKICVALTPYYDSHKGRRSYKGRPALIIGKADSEDYVVLPISKVSHKENVDATFDIPVDPVKYPKLNLTNSSYIRTHKQTVIHRGSLGETISDLRDEYEELYLEVLDKREEFSRKITEQALS